MFLYNTTLSFSSKVTIHVDAMMIQIIFTYNVRTFLLVRNIKRCFRKQMIRQLNLLNVLCSYLSLSTSLKYLRCSMWFETNCVQFSNVWGFDKRNCKCTWNDILYCIHLPRTREPVRNGLLLLVFIIQVLQ